MLHFYYISYYKLYIYTYNKYIITIDGCLSNISNNFLFLQNTMPKISFEEKSNNSLNRYRALIKYSRILSIYEEEIKIFFFLYPFFFSLNICMYI